MKKIFNLKKSKLLLLMLLALGVGGASPAWAQVTDDFSTYSAPSNGAKELGENWTIIGNDGNYSSFGSNYDYIYYNAYGEAYVAGNYASNYSKENYLVLKKQVTGTVTFKVTNGNSSSALSVYVSKANASGDTYVLTGTAQSYSVPAKQSSEKEYSFDAGDTPTYVAFCLNGGSKNLKLWSVTYTEYVAASGPSLTVKDGTTMITSPYTYNFGLATAGTTHTFALSNTGTGNIEGLSVSTTGDDFNPQLSANTTEGGDVTLTLTMPDASGNGAITISSTTEDIDDFVINVSGTIRDANKVYEYGFTSLPEDWITTGSWYYSEANGAYNTSWYLSSNARLITPLLTIAEGETFFVEAKGYSTNNTSYQHLQMQYSADGSEWTNFGDEPTLDPSNWNTFAFTGAPAGKYYIAINASQADIRMFYGGEATKAPKMVVTQPASLDFGVITEATTKTFTIANTGKATLEGINVESTNSSIFAVTGVPATLAAGESAEVTITMAATTTGALSSEITVSATDMDDVKFTVTGTVLPEGLEVVDFNDNELPAGWGNNASNKWSFADGKAYCTSAAELTTPKLQFAEGDIIAITITSYDNYDNNYLEITGSTDGSTWTAFDTKKFISRSQIPYGSYATLIVSDIPTTVQYLKFKGYYVRIDEIAGLTFSNDAPIMGYYTDSECTTAATATVVKDFGFVSEAPAAQVYYIKNDGTGTMNIALGDVPAGFTAALGKASLAAGESTTLTINMPAETKGYHGGDIVVTATNSSEEQIGTFTVTASGVMMEDGKLNLDFATTDVIPTTWIATDWTKNDGGYYRGGYSSTTIETSTLTATAGEEIVIVAKQEYASGSFSVNYKKVDADEWSTLIASTSLGNSDWVTLHAPIAEAGDYKFQINGNYYTQIQRIYGLTAVAVPFMETTAANIAFGMQTAESAEQSFTISNTGEAVLTGLSVTLGKTGDEAQYSIRMTDSEDAEFTGTTLAVDQTITVYVKQLFDSNYGSKSDVLTIAADGQNKVTINLTGTTRDPSLLYVDFDDPNTIPEGWQVGANWSVSTSGSDRYAYQSSSSTPSALVTTPLTVAAGQTLSFKVSRNGSGYGYTTSLKTRYSQDGGVTWSEYVAQYGTDSSNEAGSAYTTITLSDLPTGNLIFEFYGSNIKLDMIQGLKVATAPALALTESDAAVVNGSTKDLGNLSADGVVTYTLKNIGNAVLKSKIKGEGITVSPASLELAAGETAEITVTMAFGAPYDEKTGKMTIDSEDWVGDMVVNYTAVAVDPTDFVIDFEDNQKPAGWYSESWTYANGVARINTGIVKPLITEKIGAETGKNTLTFDAKVYYGDDEQTLKVYTSADRKTWSAAQTFTLTATSQNFSLESLADGEYYVKFEANNATIDNIKGVKKLAAPEHDLYVSATTLPTGTPYIDTEFTATATVNNLVAAAEEGVYAKLFVDNNAVATAAAATISGNGSATFSMNYTLATTGQYTAYVEVYYRDNTVAFTTLPSTFEVVNYPSLVLDETSSDALTFTTGTYDITLKRTFAAGWSTICLPFTVNVADIQDDAVAYSFETYNKETGELTFNRTTTELSAATPYVIYVPKAITTPIDFKKQALNSYCVTAQNSSSNGAYFRGTYAPVDAGAWRKSADTDVIYGVTAAGKIQKAGANASIKGFRAYFDIPAGANARLVLTDVTTGITKVIAADELDENVYNLNGQKVEKAGKGLYIINGKKVVVK